MKNLKKQLLVLFTALFVICAFSIPGCDSDSSSDNTPDKLYLFSTNPGYDGNLGGRAGADAKCKTDVNKPDGLNNVHALISVTENDCIANMPANYNFSDNIPIFSADGNFKIADDWADLTDGDIDVSLYDAGVLLGSKSNPWWSGSNSNGTLHSDNCSGWTDNSADTSGYVGDPRQTNEYWCSIVSRDANYVIRLIGIAY